MVALSHPEMTAKSTPSRRLSTAVLAARLAATSRSPAMDVEVSMMMTSAAAVDRAAWAAGPPTASTCTTAWTSWPFTGRYGFWWTSIVKSGRSLTRVAFPARWRRKRERRDDDSGGRVRWRDPSSEDCSRPCPVSPHHEGMLGVDVLGEAGQFAVGAFQLRAQPALGERNPEK